MGAGANLDGYTFVVTANNEEATIYVADYVDGKTKINIIKIEKGISKFIILKF